MVQPQVTATVHFNTSAGSGVADTYYALDGQTSSAYTGPFAINGVGTHTVQYFSTDRAGNSETPRSVTVTVDYAEDTDTVSAELKAIVTGMRQEPTYSAMMLSDLQLWGVDKVDGASVTIAGQVVCTDSGRWTVQREFNRRMKRRFQELGINIYNPTRTIALPPAETQPSSCSTAPSP